ncbi:SDR family NAD(P)-dependent oxidoreductase [Hankyongella ginsenosidimutans]|uniref:SDR family NAD(P)-dependent oxidoreductase n=1 Tax=Hankyongella ginsenosidimutans TaxID=1763828 RepID=UPI001FE8C313|nr:SDR family NAD(P)-dependent oxidoreductase [Hankyongella ginsenosidimutans]
MSRTALVTGGARRIGRAIVDGLARDGWSVVIHAHTSRAAADELAQALRARGRRPGLSPAISAIRPACRTS